MAHQTYPSDIPVPQDDGSCAHLTGSTIPSGIALPKARDPSQTVDLAKLEGPGLSIVFFYPRTAAPGETVPDEWNAIPGARGCTPQACSFRDALGDLKSLGVARVFGVSVQSPNYQAEVAERLHLPYDLLSDEEFKLQKALKLPTHDWQGGKVLRRATLAVESGGKVVNVWYPVFPPDRATEEVVKWLKARR